MARSTAYWYDVIMGEKATLSSLNSLQPNIDSSQNLLNDLTTTSKVSRWRLLAWVVAMCAFTLDTLFDLFKSELEDISNRSRYGNLRWYVYVSTTWQYGDALVYQDYIWSYPTVNYNNRIIKRAAAQESGNQVNLKVAKLSGNTPVKLSLVEKAAFIAFINEIRPARINVNVISDDPDEIKLYLKIVYDPLVLSSSGELLSSPGIFPVENIINEYLGLLPFNGVLELAFLIDKIQTVIGVSSAYIQNASARYGTNPFSNFSERYLPNAGYMVIDPLTPLNQTITYAAV